MPAGSEIKAAWDGKVWQVKLFVFYSLIGSGDSLFESYLATGDGLFKTIDQVDSQYRKALKLK